MIRQPRLRAAIVAVIASVLLLSAPAFSQAKKKKARASEAVSPQRPTLWHDPGAVESLDFVNGPGGKKHLPKPPFTFVEEDTGGTNPKVKVTDAAGQTWGVKWGSEIHSEVFASRLVWAAGYYVEAAYFVKSGKIAGVKHLSRAKKYVGSDGSFTNARFELKEKGITKQTDTESWRWDQNPFVGTRELNGLKIMIMLTSNWDPKDQRDSESNTAIYMKKKTGEVTYVMSDWGATMGKWGGVFSREKWDCPGFSSQTRKFVTGVGGGLVKFGYDGKREQDMREGIRVSDVRWLLGYVGRITDAQIRAGLGASGATAEEIDCFTTSIRDRINQLKNAVR
ncbi:MAG TPA: hypothetical protein VLM38_03640 [Blastocatellia bacterium]|nr:hypothetical protein [Blastocatellia bacterium]